MDPSLLVFNFKHVSSSNQYVWQLSCRKSYGLKGNDGIGASHDIMKPKLANWKNRCNAQLILHHGRVLIRTEPIKTSEIRIWWPQPVPCGWLINRKKMRLGKRSASNRTEIYRPIVFYHERIILISFPRNSWRKSWSHVSHLDYDWLDAGLMKQTRFSQSWSTALDRRRRWMYTLAIHI